MGRLSLEGKNPMQRADEYKDNRAIVGKLYPANNRINPQGQTR